MASDKFKAWWAGFSNTGVISPLRLGLTREELKGLLGEPDDVSLEKQTSTPPAVLKYEELEFHFFDDTLGLIYMEHDDGIPAISITKMVPGEAETT
jgi:hypothetical protein